MLPAMKASIAIAAQIRSQIAQRTLRPGDPLPVEEELTGQLGCSKPVVREALRILETEGLIEVRRGVGGGARVRGPSVVHAAEAVSLQLQMGDVPVLDVWEARDRIIASAVERLALDRRASVLAPVGAAVDALESSLGDLAAFNEHMLQVGEVAVTAAGNATERLLVGALRHIVAAEVRAATLRVRDEEGLRQARLEGKAIAAAWRRALAEARAGRPRAARRACERQADGLRALIGASIEGLTVGAAAAISR